MYNNNYPWENQQYSEPPQQSRITAAYKADALADGVIAPVLKSAFLGFTLGVLAGLLVWQFGFPRGVHPLMAWLIVWFTVMPLTFWTFTRRGQWLIERISGADLNGDGYIGQPVQQPMLPSPDPVRVVVEQEQGRHVDYIDLPEKVTHEQMATFARAVLSGRDLAEGVWGGPGGLWSMPTYRKLRDILVQRKLLRWNNETEHARGITLTPAGRAVLRKFANSPTLEDK